MKNGNDELSKVPRLMEQWRESRGTKWPALLQARAVLMDACEGLVATASKESRGLNTDECSAIDGHMAQIREINGNLAKIKADRVAEYGADQVHVPF
jgi:hypothetical protein